MFHRNLKAAQSAALQGARLRSLKYKSVYLYHFLGFLFTCYAGKIIKPTHLQILSQANKSSLLLSERRRAPWSAGALRRLKI
ncbi:MAG: hypothetical protein K940chlam2_01766 [Chlamydiae bacterium]|nr:hypothetical protein [Chlamydiota bacterium]